MPLEPITAALNALAAWFIYLGTPEGQKLAAQMNAASADFGKQMGDLFAKLHAQILAAK